MKNRLLSFLFVGILLTGCSQSLTERAETLVRTEMESTLVLPESYDPISTQVDSAFYPMDSPEFYAKIYKLVQLSEHMAEVDRKMTSAKSSMALWSDNWSAYSKARYQEEKAKFDKYESQLEEFNKQGLTLVDEIKELVSSTPEFMGYKVIHRYRAQNNKGQVLIGECEIGLDQELTKVYYNFSTDDPIYLASREALEKIRAQ